MSLFLITGLPGSGKSTICAELKARGYEAYDGDEDKLAKWYNISTGKATEESGYQTYDSEFLRTHTRDIAPATVERLVAQAEDKICFLCGDPANELELQPLFDKIFALILDAPARRHRLLSRTNNQWGKLPHERAYSDMVGKKWEVFRQQSDYVTLDATQSPSAITDQILVAINS